MNSKPRERVASKDSISPGLVAGQLQVHNFSEWIMYTVLKCPLCRKKAKGIFLARGIVFM